MPPSSKRRGGNSGKSTTTTNNNNNNHNHNSSFPEPAAPPPSAALLAAEMKRKETCFPSHNHNNTTNDATTKKLSANLTDEDDVVLDTAAPSAAMEDGCLHCHSVSNELQVRCDECQSYICPACHWCHEYQANHEIRVCDRCDAFYCRNCDEMDQCDDCGEVVCASCSTLLSCKFCGGGLCEECATACGRCGIVLCSRDAKFAVDCDTCRLSYCLVCLASGSKDPCVRCQHRPSKRMEQLVHLRLKSIYKAFKQSSRSPIKNFNNTTSPADIQHHLHHPSETGPTIAELEEGMEDAHGGNLNLHHDSALSSWNPMFRTKTTDDPMLLDENDAAFMAAAAVASQQSQSQQQQQQQQFNPHAPIRPDALAEKFLEEKQKQADAAAEALLAELEEEEEAAKTKKSKKKRKKERQQQQKVNNNNNNNNNNNKEDDVEDAGKEENLDNVNKNNDGGDGVGNDGNVDEDEPVDDSKPKATPNKKKGGKTQKGQATPSNNNNSSKAPAKDHASSKGDSSTQKVGNASPAAVERNLNATTPTTPTPTTTTLEMDPIEKRLFDCVDKFDTDGIEGILFELKGVPGRAALRKNAKKALKRFKAPATETEEPGRMNQEPLTTTNPPTASSASHGGPVELLKLMSDYKMPGKQPNRAECVMQMSPMVVGWVIGKGGQRIRDLMEESGAKVWIDQEKAGPEDPRNVYISGDRKAVDQAVHMVRDIVSKAPIDGASKYAPKDDPAVVDDPQETVADSEQATGAPMPGSDPPPASAPARAPLSVPPAPGLVPVQAMAPLEPGDGANLFEHIMTCEARFVPLLIGKRGWAIKDIQDKSGARVDIDQTVTPRQIRISGSKPSVEKAIPMVRDVLSYPHAQPQPGGSGLPVDGVEQLLGVAAALQQHDTSSSAAQTDDRRHTPPPSKYITTGDAKSVISASSSLSSTPEPSMASSSKGLPLQFGTGPLIQPPDYNLQQNNQVHEQSPPNLGHYLPQDMQRGLSHMGERGAFVPRQPPPPPAMYGGSGLMGMQHLPGIGMPPPHPNHDQIYTQGPQPAPGPLGHNMMHNQSSQAGFSGNGLVSPGSSKAMHGGAPGFAMMGPATHRSNSVGPMGGMPHQQLNQPSPQVPNLNRYNSMPTSGGGLIPGQGGPAGFDVRCGNPLGGGWDGSQAARNYTPAPGIPPGGMLAHGVGSAGPQAPSNLGLGPDPGHFGSPFHHPAPVDGVMARGGHPSSISLVSGFDLAPGLDHQGGAAPMGSLRDDARIIDSLFGPATNTSSTGDNTGNHGDPSQNMLTGLQGLSLGGADGLGSGGAAPGTSLGAGGTGLWGDPLPDWNTATEAASNVLEPTNSKDAAFETSILAGLQPFNVHEDTTQHPPQSRWNWGSTNA